MYYHLTHFLASLFTCLLFFIGTAVGALWVKVASERLQVPPSREAPMRVEAAASEFIVRKQRFHMKIETSSFPRRESEMGLHCPHFCCMLDMPLDRM
nr:uncharacterized protein LOC105494914 isoform X2 [Macaca nemestrina]